MDAPLISVVIATRDRAVLFGAALRSVLAQRGVSVEVIVVNDGSADEHTAAYEAELAPARAQLGERLQSHRLVRRPRGHGQSYSLNFGADHARGRYLCFLDDDDEWTDAEHLARLSGAVAAADAAGQPVDLYLANQQAWQGGVRLERAVWIEALAGQLQAGGAQPDAQGLWLVSVEALMRCGGFCHLNALTVRRELWQRIGGMDEGIRWECDRDVFLRLVDQAGVIVHHPAVVSRHNVPDPKAGTSMTTMLGDLDRRMWQLRVLDKAALLLQHPVLRAHAREHKAYALQRIAVLQAGLGHWRTATAYAFEACAQRPRPGVLALALRSAWRALRSPR